jgi:hypothetical protein
MHSQPCFPNEKLKNSSVNNGGSNIEIASGPLSLSLSLSLLFVTYESMLTIYLDFLMEKNLQKMKSI